MIVALLHSFMDSSYPLVLIPPKIAKCASRLPSHPEISLFDEQKPSLFPEKASSKFAFKPSPLIAGFSLFGCCLGGYWAFTIPFLGIALLIVVAIASILFFYCDRREKQRIDLERKRIDEKKLQQSRDRENKPTLAASARKKQESDRRLAQWRSDYKIALIAMRKQLAKTAKPGKNKLIPRGYSEKSFESTLKQYFPGKIYIGKTLHNPKFSRGFSYTADFTYIDENGLHIDIELDEPYVYNTQKPIHFRGIDNRRNQFFLSRRWMVIRFCEEQTVRYPRACCRAIAEVIFNLYRQPLPSQYAKLPQLPSFSQWTRREAKEMARREYRQTYLRP